MRVLMVDNYDSFTYNLVQYLGELGADLEVVRNDVTTVDDLLARDYDRVVVSPGPCTPNEAGISVEVMRRFPEAGVTHDGKDIFAGLPDPLPVARYHSLVVHEDLPPELEATAHGGGVLMAMRHRSLPAIGVQFHPESVLTPDGKQLLRNFLA
jgi:anthranilate/para-aminobenzoate synthase component II